MFKLGIIGAGSISERHIKAYKQIPECTVKAIADINTSLATERAKEFNIKDVYSDYKELLNDDDIDAVVIATPTFTHKSIVIDALKKGKHVLCEKPPAMNADEVKECKMAEKASGKLLMFAFVTRFRSQLEYLKKYIDSGKMGKIICAECFRVERCAGSESWFASREMGGGYLIDSAIHELDNALYLMGYPKPLAVIASQSFANGDLYERLNGTKSVYHSRDLNKYKRTVESAISGLITLENGASIYVKTAPILNSVTTGTYVEISGEKAGARLEPFANIQKDRLKMIELTDDNYLVESNPILSEPDLFLKQASHFVDCCTNGTECISKTGEAIILMDIIRALYKSADTNQPVLFK